MPEFNFHIKLDNVVDQATHQAFTDMLRQVTISMDKIAQSKITERQKCEEMQAEIASLRAENDQLREEVGMLASLRLGQQAVKESANSTKEIFTLERTIKIHESPVHSVTMSPDSKVVATASWDASVKLYDLAAEEVIKTLTEVQSSPLTGEVEKEMGGLYAVAFAKTAPEILGCTSVDNKVYLWNHHTGKLCRSLSGHKNEVNGIDFHESQQVMCTASDDCKVLIWDFSEGIMLRTLDKHTKAVYGATFLGRAYQYLVATCSFDRKTRIFDMRDKSVVATLQTHTDDVIGIDYSPHQHFLATGSDDGLIGLWCIRKWKPECTFNTREIPNLFDNEVKRVSFSPNGDMLAAACSSGRVLVYNIKTMMPQPVAELDGHTDCVFDVTWGVCPQTQAKVLISASHDHSCRYWREVDRDI